MASGVPTLSHTFFSVTYLIACTAVFDLCTDGPFLFLLREQEFVTAALHLFIPWSCLRLLSERIEVSRRGSAWWKVSHAVRGGLIAAIITFNVVALYLMETSHEGRQNTKQLVYAMVVGLLVSLGDVVWLRHV